MIYLIKAYGKDKILLKIGHTDNLDKRLHGYITHTPDYELLQIREGDQPLEQDLQNYFKEFNYNNEWFYYSDKIVNEFSTIIPPKKDIAKSDYTKLRKEFFNKLKEQCPDQMFNEFLTNLYIRTNKNSGKEADVLVEDFKNYYSTMSIGVINFLETFYKECKNTSTKMKLLCETIQSGTLSQAEVDQIFLVIPNFFQNFYYGLGPERCKIMGYNYTRMDKEYNMKFFNLDNVLNKVLENFHVGDKLSNIEVKDRLREIYASLRYKKTPKASDLEEWFEVKTIKLKDSSGKWVHGIELIRVK